MRSGHIIIRCVSGARDVRGIGVEGNVLLENEPLPIFRSQVLGDVSKKDIV